MKSDNRAKVASASRMVLVAALSVFFVSVGAAVAQAQESCSGRVELWFLNDESTSVTDTEFSDAKSFISSVASSFAYDESTGFRGSLIGWEDSPTLLSGLTDQFTTVASTYSRGGRDGYTYPGAAFDYVADALTNYDGSAYASSSGEPAREGVPSIVVFLTDADGVDSAIGRVRDASQLRASASAIRNAGHEVVVMLIAEAASRYTLGDGDYEANFYSLMNEVAGSAGNVVVGDTYANIAQPTQGYISDLSSRICSVAEQLSPALPPVVSRMLWKFPGGALRACEGSVF
ncbi:VWA domain-containing protein [Phaeobacter sp. CAU 1743]|uniref:VWA domain-containing protein n=1 Tax=Phaeobacter sp. CAU 1743 TaxID=3140367 RepID=UPI00325AE4A9